MAPRIPTLLLCAAVLAGASGCAGCAAPPAPAPAPDAGPTQDAGTLPAVQDGGTDAGVHPDAGTSQEPDAGPPFQDGFADEPCPEDAWELPPPDGGFPEGTVLHGLCIALRRFQGTARLDGQPVTAPVSFTFDGDGFQGQYQAPAPGGHFGFQVMRGRYQNLLYHPDELVQQAGAKDLGAVDLRHDASRDVDVKTWMVAGATFFAGQPWPSTSTPPDTTVSGFGLPSQSAWTRSVGGGYEVRLMAGQFTYEVSVPYESLGETKLTRYPVVPYLTLDQDRTVDIDLPTSELSGNLTVDGAPLPDRIPAGPDYRLRYQLVDGVNPVVETIHEGGGAFFSAIVPRGKYAVLLELDEAKDPSLPSTLSHKQLAPELDLTSNQSVAFALHTRKIEGVLMVDGQPVHPNPSATWALYAYAYPQQDEPWFVANYQVPFTTAAFSLKAFPAQYYLSLWLDGNFRPDLASGWYDVDTKKDVTQDVSLPIDVHTQTLDGTLSLDGVPASNALTSVGTLYFQSLQGTYSWKVKTTDGRFHVRLPQGQYTVFFQLNPDAYPGYAVGRAELARGLDLTQPQQAAFDYRTVAVAGPLRVGGAPLPDTFSPQPEAALSFLPQSGPGPGFYKTLQGGEPWYSVRVPAHDYKLRFELKKDAVPGVAWGTAALGNGLQLEPAQ